MGAPDIRIPAGTLLDPTADNDLFKLGQARGKFLLPVCKACGKAHWYPRAHCPLCRAEDTIEWTEASGKGTIYTYSVMRKADPVYAIAYVELAEGPRVMTNIVDCDFDKLHIGMAVETCFREVKGLPVAMFKPA